MVIRWALASRGSGSKSEVAEGMSALYGTRANACKLLQTCRLERTVHTTCSYALSPMGLPAEQNGELAATVTRVHWSIAERTVVTATALQNMTNAELARAAQNGRTIGIFARLSARNSLGTLHGPKCPELQAKT